MIDQAKMGELLLDGAKKLLAASDMAIDTLVELAQHSTNDLVRVRAAEDILDRAGFRPGVEIDVRVTSSDASPTSVIAERLDRLANGMAALEAAAATREPVDAEIVEEEAEDG